MKTAKRLIAIILGIVILICSVAVIAAVKKDSDSAVPNTVESTVTTEQEITFPSIGDEIKRARTNADGEIKTFTGVYSGELGDGEIKAFSSENNSYFLFNAEKDGYYFYSCINLIWNYDLSKQEDEGNIYCEETAQNDTFYGSVCYLKKGTYLLFTYDTPLHPKEVTIEYYGEITDCKLDKPTDCMIIGQDLYYSEGNSFFDETGFEFHVTFSSGKSLRIDPISAVKFHFDSFTANAPVEVNFELLGKTHNRTFNVYEANYFVESIEVENKDSFVSAFDEYGLFEGKKETYKSGKIKVNFTDGTSKELEYSASEMFTDMACEYFELPNGKECYINACYSESGSEYHLVIRMGNCVLYDEKIDF